MSCNPVDHYEAPCQCSSCKSQDPSSFHWTFYVETDPSGVQTFGIQDADDNEVTRWVELPPELQVCYVEPS